MDLTVGYSNASSMERARSSFLFESRNLQLSSPLFASLAALCADDPDMLMLGKSVRTGQPVGRFILLAAHFLILSEPDAAVGKYFKSVTPSPKPHSDAFPEFRAFCIDRGAQLERLLSTRTVGTTLPDRASYILPAVHAVSKVVNQPLNIIEIGCSAGLNLIFDTYQYDYGDGVRHGDPNSPLTLSCTVIGGAPGAGLEMPRIERRVGIDLVPIDLSDASDRRWIEAMLLPEWELDRQRLRLALSLAADRHLELVKGDAMTALPDILEAITGPVCIIISHALCQWPRHLIDEFDRLLRCWGYSHPIHRLDIEAVENEPREEMRARLLRLANAGFSLTEKSMASNIVHCRYENGACEKTRLGIADGFGRWIDWRTQI
jgi:hypothetical protein